MSSGGLRVGQFITQYPYEDQFSRANEYFCSGAERVAKRLSEELAERDCDVTVCTSSANGEYVVEKQGDVVIERSPSIGSVNTTQVAPTQVVDPVTKGLEFDVVHAHNSTPPGVIAGWTYAAVNDVPFVITHHGGEAYESHGSLVRRLGLFAYTEMLIEPLFRSADVAVSPTEGYVDESAALSSATDVAVIPNGIDVEEFEVGLSAEEAKRHLGFGSESFLVLYVGSLHQRKGVDILLDAFLRFRERHSEARLVIGGSGALEDDLRETVEREEASDAVSIPGFIPESEKATYMNAADVFVLPSVTAGAEVYPLVLLEAAAARTPVIASRFETIQSVVGPNEMGTLAEPGAEESLLTELERLYEDGETRRVMSTNAYRTARGREWSAIAEQYHELYGRLLR